MCLLSLKNMQTSFIKGQCSEVSQVSTLKLLPMMQYLLLEKCKMKCRYLTSNQSHIDMIPISHLNWNKISSLDTQSNYYLICKACLEIKSLSLCHLKKENSSQKYNLQCIIRKGAFLKKFILFFPLYIKSSHLLNHSCFQQYQRSFSG